MIRRMNNIRNIISEERLLFIKAQDYMTEIDHKAKSLEDLGNGLRMIDFEQLRAETQSLSDKIEGIHCHSLLTCIQPQIPKYFP